MKLTNLSVSCGTRRAALPPWHRRNLPPPRPERRAPVPTLTVRLGRMAPVAAVLSAVLANLTGKERAL